MHHDDRDTTCARARAHTLAASITEAAQRLPAELVTRTALRRVRRVAARLPASLTRTFYLECRLQAGDSRTDLIIEIDEDGRDIIALANPAQRLARALRQPAWRKLERFCAEWRTHDALAALVKRIWLEYDVNSNARHTLAAPGVFVNFRHDAEHAQPVDPNAVHDALHALSLTPSRSVQRAVADCLAALPACAFVPYVGAFAGRAADTVRVCIQGLGPDALEDYLLRIRWPGRCAAVTRTIADAMLSRSDSATPAPSLMHFDIARAPLPTLGFEFALERGPQFRGSVAEQRFLDYLLAAGLVTPAKRAALTRVAGCTLATLPHQLWRSVLVRQVNHIKLVFDTNGTSAAKAYLLFSAIPHPFQHHVVSTGQT